MNEMHCLAALAGLSDCFSTDNTKLTDPNLLLVAVQVYGHALVFGLDVPATVRRRLEQYSREDLAAAILSESKEWWLYRPYDAEAVVKGVVRILMATRESVELLRGFSEIWALDRISRILG